MAPPGFEADFGEGDALIESLTETPHREKVFLVGSPLTMPEAPGEAGVPGVSGVIDLICEALSSSPGAVEQIRKIEQQNGAPAAYREAFRQIGNLRDQDTANVIIRRAVLQARQHGVGAADVLARASSLDRGQFEAACTVLRDDVSGWHVRPSLLAFGQILVGHTERFGKTVLTTNFDPLIEIAITSQGGQSHRTVLHADGALGAHHGSGAHVVYLHGSWYESDTLHTAPQLRQDRPQLKASLKALLSGRTLVVLGYGGWDDILTHAVAELAADQDAWPDIVWTFREADATEIARKYANVLAVLERCHPTRARSPLPAHRSPRIPARPRRSSGKRRRAVCRDSGP